MTEQPPSPGSEIPIGSRCENCDRPLVTTQILAQAIHSGCALTREKHTLDECPSRETFMLDAGMIHGYIRRHASEQD
jgi:hypothetical protein